MKTKPEPKRKAKSSTSLGIALIAGMQEALAHVRGEITLPSRVYHPPAAVDVMPIRKQMGMSQARFADAFGLNVRTLRDWEQGRRQPDGMARILLAVIGRDPKLVQQVLRDHQPL